MRGFARAGRWRAPAPPGDFVVAGGVRVHYVRAGAGPPVIYVHGAKGSVYDFTLSVGERLAERYTALAMDRPGSGFSARPAKGENTPQAQAAVLRAAATELGLRRPILIGHSLGAAVTLAWALDGAGRGGGRRHARRLRAPAGRRPAVGRHAPAPPGGAPRRGRSSAAPVSGARSSGAPSSGRSLRAARRTTTCASRRGWRSRPPALISDGEDRKVVEDGLAALRPLYPGLRVPLVILVGAQDRIVPPAVSERLHALVPGSELVRVPGAGHMPQFTAPDAVVAAVDRAAELAGAAPTFASPRDARVA